MTTDTKAPSRLAGPVTECLACGGPVWDNRGDKRSPKHPDFKCKDKAGCDWAGWLQDGAAGTKKPTPRPDGVVTVTPGWRELYAEVVEFVAGTWPDGTPPEVLGQQVSTVFIKLAK
jgi:hypothetical protein